MKATQHSTETSAANPFKLPAEIKQKIEYPMHVLMHNVWALREFGNNYDECQIDDVTAGRIVESMATMVGIAFDEILDAIGMGVDVGDFRKLRPLINERGLQAVEDSATSSTDSAH